MTVLQSMQEAQRGINTILQYCFWGKLIKRLYFAIFNPPISYSFFSLGRMDITINMGSGMSNRPFG